MIIIQIMKIQGYRKRALQDAVENALRAHPVVVVSGARQTGKTTLVRNLPSSGKRVFETLDDLDVLEVASKRPEELLARGRRLTVDEVQRVPGLLLAIKRDVDRRRQNGRFLLTGSANLMLMRQVADSLAGRAVYMLLSPFTAGEKRGEGTVPPWQGVLACKNAQAAVDLVRSFAIRKTDIRSEILTGGMPPAVLARSAIERSHWFEGFVRTYVERDLRDVSQVSSLPDFRRLMTLAAHRIGQIANQSELARDAGLSQATAHRHINLLETTYQVHRLPVYGANPSKRLIKAPKLYWTDSGLAAHLVGLTGLSAVEKSPRTGALLENLILTGLLAWRESVHPRPELFYWRTAGGAEVDFVIERGARLLPVEIKKAKQVGLSDIRHLELFLGDYKDKASWAALLHDTDEPHLITAKVAGLPISHFF